MCAFFCPYLWLFCVCVAYKICLKIRLNWLLFRRILFLFLFGSFVVSFLAFQRIYGSHDLCRFFFFCCCCLFRILLLWMSGCSELYFVDNRKKKSKPFCIYCLGVHELWHIVAIYVTFYGNSNRRKQPIQIDETIIIIMCRLDIVRPDTHFPILLIHVDTKTFVNLRER